MSHRPGSTGEELHDKSLQWSTAEQEVMFSTPPSVAESAVQRRLENIEQLLHQCIQGETARQGTSDDAQGAVAVQPPHVSSGMNRMLILIEAQRNRSNSIEQRVCTIEKKMNGFLSDLVEQTQTEVRQRKKLISLVDQKLQEQSVALRQATESYRRAAPALPYGDTAALPHTLDVTAILHERVEEIHDTLLSWRQQHYTAMEAVVNEMRMLKAENQSLKRQIAELTAAMGLNGSFAGVA